MAPIDDWNKKNENYYKFVNMNATNKGHFHFITNGVQKQRVQLIYIYI
jgi:hypothetical protein